MSKLEHLEDYEHLLPDDKIVYVSRFGDKFTVAHIKQLCPNVEGVLDATIKYSKKYKREMAYLPWRGGDHSARRFEIHEIPVLLKRKSIATTLDMNIWVGSKPGLNKFFESFIRIDAKKDNILRAIGFVEEFKNLPDDAPEGICSKTSVYRDLQKRKNKQMSTIEFQEKYNLKYRTPISDAVYNINYVTNGKVNLLTENTQKNGVQRITRELYLLNPNFLNLNQRGIIINGKKIKPCK